MVIPTPLVYSNCSPGEGASPQTRLDAIALCRIKVTQKLVVPSSMYASVSAWGFLFCIAKHFSHFIREEIRKWPHP